MHELLKEFEDLVSEDTPLVFKERNIRPPTKNHKEPMFYLSVEYNFGEIDQSLMITESLPEFIPPPIGAHTFRDFHILYHIHLIQP